MLANSTQRKLPLVTWLLLGLAAINGLIAVLMMGNGITDPDDIYKVLTYTVITGSLSVFGFLGRIPMIGDDANKYLRQHHGWIVMGLVITYISGIILSDKISIDYDIFSLAGILFAVWLVLLQIKDED